MIHTYRRRRGRRVTGEVDGRGCALSGRCVLWLPDCLWIGVSDVVDMADGYGVLADCTLVGRRMWCCHLIWIDTVVVVLRI